MFDLKRDLMAGVVGRLIPRDEGQSVELERTSEAELDHFLVRLNFKTEPVDRNQGVVIRVDFGK